MDNVTRINEGDHTENFSFKIFFWGREVGVGGIGVKFFLVVLPLRNIDSIVCEIFLYIQLDTQTSKYLLKVFKPSLF